MDAPSAVVVAGSSGNLDAGRMVLALPGTATISAATLEAALKEDGSFGRSYIVQGEQLRVWLVMDTPLTRERATFLAALDILCSFTAPGRAASDAEPKSPAVHEALPSGLDAASAAVETVKMDDGGGAKLGLDLSDRKPKHVPNIDLVGPWGDAAGVPDGAQAVQCRGGWKAVGVADRSVLFLDVPVLLQHRWEGSEIVLAVHLKTPAFVATDSLSRYAERRVRTRDCAMRVRVCRPISIEIDKNPLFISHDTTICATIQNPPSSTFPIAFARLSLVEGSARYLGPAGMQPISFADFFTVRIESASADGALSTLLPGESQNLFICIRPKPQAYVQFTDWTGTFSCRVVASWRSPQLLCDINSFKDIYWRGPRSNYLCVVCQIVSAIRVREVFSVNVTVNNISDHNLLLTLNIQHCKALRNEAAALFSGGAPAAAAAMSLSMSAAAEDGDGGAETGLICLDSQVLIGTLTSKSKASVIVRFVALRAGTFIVDNISLADSKETHTLVEPWVIHVPLQ